MMVINYTFIWGGLDVSGGFVMFRLCSRGCFSCEFSLYAIFSCSIFS